MSKDKPTLLLAIKMWNFILFWCDYLSSFLHSHYLCTVFIFCKCYYKELAWVIPDSVWNFGYYKIFCEMLFFPSQIYLKATFYTAQNFLYPLRFSYYLHSYWTETKLVALTFFSPVLSSYWTSGYTQPQSFKVSFLIVIAREQNYTSASLQEDHK